MAIRNIVKEEDDLLRKKSRKVDNFDKRLATLLDDMGETLRDAEGAGLAAAQVGVLRRVFIVIDENDKVLEFINPEIVEEDGSQVTLEGCLSIPGYFAYTERPMKVTIKAVDRNGQPFTISAEGFLAKALTHEYDHLDGILFRTHVVREEDEGEEDGE